MQKTNITPRHIKCILQKIKNKEKILKPEWGENLTYGGGKTRIISNFSSEIMQARIDWTEIFSVKRKNPPT